MLKPSTLAVLLTLSAASLAHAQTSFSPGLPQPLLVKQAASASAEPSYTIQSVGPRGISLIDNSAVLWTTSATSMVCPIGTTNTPVTHLPAEAASNTLGWAKIKTGVQKAMLYEVPNTVCYYASSALLLTNGTLQYAGARTGGSCASSALSDWQQTWSTLTTGVKDFRYDGYPNRYWALKTDDTLWGGGLNANGQIGPGYASASPSCTDLSPAQRAVDALKPIYVTNTTNAIVLKNGTLRFAGNNDSGQWGYNYTGTYSATSNGTVLTRKGAVTWTDATTLGLVKDYRLGPGGLHTTVVLRPDGTLVTGDAAFAYGTVATGVKKTVNAADLYLLKTDGTLQRASTATRLPTTLTTGVADIKSDAQNNLLVLKTDGTVWALGPNANGHLGTGSIAAVATLTQVASNVKEIAINQGVSVLLKVDGTLWAAGDNTQTGFKNNLPATTIPYWVQLTSPGDLAAQPASASEGTLATAASAGPLQLSSGATSYTATLARYTNGTSNLAIRWKTGDTTAITPYTTAPRTLNLTPGSAMQFRLDSYGGTWDCVTSPNNTPGTHCYIVLSVNTAKEGTFRGGVTYTYSTAAGAQTLTIPLTVTVTP